MNDCNVDGKYCFEAAMSAAAMHDQYSETSLQLILKLLNTT